MRTTTLRGALLVAAASAALVGCDRGSSRVTVEQKGTTSTTRTTTTTTTVATTLQGMGATGALDAAGNAIAGAADATADAVSDAVSGAAQTVDVKAALMANTTVDASHIDVDTNGTTKTVTLKGSVHSAEQKAEAERIARDHAAGWTVVNNLQVTPAH